MMVSGDCGSLVAPLLWWNPDGNFALMGCGHTVSGCWSKAGACPCGDDGSMEAIGPNLAWEALLPALCGVCRECRQSFALRELFVHELLCARFSCLAPCSRRRMCFQRALYHFLEEEEKKSGSCHVDPRGFLHSLEFDVCVRDASLADVVLRCSLCGRGLGCCGGGLVAARSCGHSMCTECAGRVRRCCPEADGRSVRNLLVERLVFLPREKGWFWRIWDCVSAMLLRRW